MGEFDPGPLQLFHDLFDASPDYTPFRDHFWFDWGPVSIAAGSTDRRACW